MQQKKPDKKAPENQSSEHYEYEICEVQSAGCIKKYGMYVSEPWKYAGTHILLHCGMILHYYATFPYLHLALGIINIVLHFLCTLVLIKLAFTDPGMIPKIFPSYEKLAYQQIPTNYNRYASLLRYCQKHYRTVIKGHNLQLKFCNTCYIYRPPRTVHCQDCGICIQKFDHHCPWIGTCVAKRNYKYFLFFLSVLSILTVKIFIESIVVSAEYSHWEGSQIIAKSVINIFLCIYIFPAMGFAVFMLILHLRFVATNVTTNQFCKQTWQTLEGNPFKKKSWFKNIFKTISLHYQGRIKLEQRIYDRNNRMLMESYSLNSLNDTKEVNKTIENFNNVNEFKSKNHQNYSTNNHIQQDKEREMQNFQLNHRKKNKMIRQNSNERTQKRQIQPQFHDQNPSAYDNPISIYDIGFRLHCKANSQYKRSETNEHEYQSSSRHSSSQKASASVLSQKDRQQYDDDINSKQQERKLKVIIEENQPDQHYQAQSSLKNQPIVNQARSPNKFNKQTSIIKMESQSEPQFDSRILGVSAHKPSKDKSRIEQNCIEQRNQNKITQIPYFSSNEQNHKSQLIKQQNVKKIRAEN